MSKNDTVGEAGPKTAEELLQEITEADGAGLVIVVTPRVPQQNTVTPDETPSAGTDE